MNDTNGTALEGVSRFVLGSGGLDGSDRPVHLATVRLAMEAGAWVHTSSWYGGGNVCQLLREAFAEHPGQRSGLIVKCDGQGPDLLRQTVEEQLTLLGVDRIDLAQLCGNPAAEGFQAGQPLRETMVALQREGKVGAYLMEVFWPYSPNAMACLSTNKLAGFIFYYNISNREVSNELYDAMRRADAPVVSLRTLNGGPKGFFWGNDRDPAEAQAALEPIRGSMDPVEFRVRFLFSDPLVRSTIGGARSPEHLQQLLDACQDATPLPDEVLESILALHRQWFAERGLDPSLQA